MRMLFALLLIGFLPAVSIAGPVVVNGDFETPEAGNSAQAFGWQKAWNGYSRSVDQPEAFSGKAFLVLYQSGNIDSYAAARQRVVLDQTVARPVRITAMVRGKDIASSSADKFGATIYGEIHLTDGRILYSKHSDKNKNVGTFDWRACGWNTATIGVDEPISFIDIYPFLGRVPGKAGFDRVEAVEYESPGWPAVTIMLDDGYKTAKTVAWPQLASRGWRGTVAGIVDEIQSQDPLYLNLEDLKELCFGGGWTLASHSISHRDLTVLSPAEVENELAGSKSFFAANGLTADHFVLPFGAFNAEVLASTGRHYLSARRVERADNPYGVLSFDVRMQEVEGRTTDADIDYWLAHAKANKRWLILVFHNLADVPDDPYAVRPEMFTRILEKIGSSGIRVMTYSEAFMEYNSGVPRSGVRHWNLY